MVAGWLIPSYVEVALKDSWSLPLLRLRWRKDSVGFMEGLKTWPALIQEPADLVRFFNLFQLTHHPVLSHKRQVLGGQL